LYYKYVVGKRLRTDGVEAILKRLKAGSLITHFPCDFQCLLPTKLENANDVFPGPFPSSSSCLVGIAIYDSSLESTGVTTLGDR